MRIEIIEIGDELGMILPDEVLTRLGVKAGDDVFLVERASGLHLERKAAEDVHGTRPDDQAEPKERPE